jgi:hypothetical protein
LPPLSFASAPKKSKKKHSHKQTIEIFQDAIFEDDTAATIREGPAPKHYIRTRLPLKERTDSGNSSPSPSPRLPVTPRLPTTPRLPRAPVRASVPDPLWEEDKENQDPNPVAPSARYVSSVPPMPPAGPPSPFYDSPAIGRGTFSSAFLPLPEPVNTTLYVILGLADWNASAAEIRSAWRQAALVYHPDHHSEENQVVATSEMQKLNAAKEVLLDARRRRNYHVTGELPVNV